MEQREVGLEDGHGHVADAVVEVHSDGRAAVVAEAVHELVMSCTSN